MNKYIALLIMMTVVINASASTNYVANGSFEQTFTDNYGQTVDAAIDGSSAYGSGATATAYMPSWSADANWGYASNPNAAGTANPWGEDYGLTAASDGDIAYGARGNNGSYFDIHQNTGAQAAEGDTVTLTLDTIALSGDYGVNAWLNIYVQFLGDSQAQLVYVNTPQDVWTAQSLEVVVSAGQAGKDVRVQLQGAGVHVDNVRLEIETPPTNYVVNGNFEQSFADGYGGIYTGAPNTLAYVGNGTPEDGQFLPGWSNNPTWGYVWNPAGSGGVNHFGTAVGLTSVAEGNGACGAWGSGGHVMDIWQNTGAQAQEGDTVRLTFDSNALSGDLGGEAWLQAKVRFAGGGQEYVAYANTPQDVWVPQTLEVVVSELRAGRDIEVYFVGAGVWIDDVRLEIDSFSTDAAWSPTQVNGGMILFESASSMTLGWNAGEDAVQHDVYFGASETDVTSGEGGTYQGRQAGLSFDPGTLEGSTTYYWRVDEVDGVGGVVTGEVWSFVIGAEPRDLYADTWVATDALGRSLPNITACGPSRADRVPGMFYFLWQGGHATPGPHDVTAILAQDPNNPAWVGGSGMWYWWAKPEADYFVAEDEWMIRRNISMLTDAGIKVLYLDATNSFDYRPAYMKLFEVLHQMKFEGYDTPIKIVFFTHSFSPTTVTRIYDEFYQQGTYSNLWYMMDGKPLMLGYPDGDSYNGQEGPVSTEVRDFFTWRRCWYTNHRKSDSTEWSWESQYPQGYSYNGDRDRPEQMAITPTGARGPNSREGRSYSSVTGQPAHDEYHLPVTGTEGDGLHFDDQIGRVLEHDPEHLFITGWNEWVGARWQRYEGDDLDGLKHLGERTEVGDYFFVDQYNQEYSRDIAPMAGGHTDNYYFQMIDGIRQYTGVRLPPVASGASTIAIDGSFGDWEHVTPEFRDTIGDTFHRNHEGWGTAGPHINNTGRNDFLDMKVARDDTYVYFYAKTREALTAYTDPNWMLLFINSDQDHATGWEGYDFVLNRSPGSASLTTLEQTSSGWNWTSTSSSIEYIASGNEIEIRVPRALIGQGGGDDPVALDFHWADNIQADDDIIQFGISGDSAPNRRFDYRYQSLDLLETVLVSDSFESGVEGDDWGDWDITTAQSYAGAHSLECSLDDPEGLIVSVPTGGQESFRVSFKYKLKNISDAEVWYHDGTDWVLIDQIGQAEEGVWLQYTDVRYNSGADAQFFNGAVAFHVQAGAYMSSSDQFVWIDDVEVTGYSESAAAAGAYPPDGATGVPRTADLSWSAGVGALSHDVYFGTSSPGVSQGNQSDSETFDPGALEYGTTYYWRIDEQTAGGTELGAVWSFTTEPAPPAVEIYAAWATGFGIDSNATGAVTVDIEPDGLDNLAEYALGGNPTINDAVTVMPVFDVSGAGSSKVVEYTYRRRRDAAARGLTYGLNVSSNLLVDWMSVGDAYETGTAIIDPDFESVTNEVPFETDEGFITLEIEKNF